MPTRHSYREHKDRLNKQGGPFMKRVSVSTITFANACQLMRWHFHPLGFEARLDASGSMIARLFNRASGETMIAVAGIPCATEMNVPDVERIIEAVEDELESLIPPLALNA